MHRITKVLGIIVIFILLTGVAQAGDWPMFHHDARHTGYTTESIPDDLELLWSYETGNFVSSSPAVANGKVFVSSGDHKIYCLNVNNGRLIWNFETGFFAYSPAIVDGKVFVGSDDHKIYCLNENTGELIWSYDTGYLVYSSPVVANGKVFVGSGDRKIYCLNENTGELVWSFETGNSVSSPAVADGMVFVGSCDHKIYCLDEDTGNLIWSYKTGGLVVSSPAVADGKVFVGSHDHKIYCFNENTGNLIWSFETGDTMHSSPAVADGKVFVGSDDNKIYCLDGDTGNLIWSYKTGHHVFSSPAVANGKVFVGSRDNKIYCLEEDNGKLLWSYGTGGDVISSPAVADGKVFVGSFDDKIYCFGVPPAVPTVPPITSTPTPIPIAVATPTPEPGPTPIPTPTPAPATPTPTPERQTTVSTQKTPTYAPSPEELPYGSYYTRIEIFTQSGLEDLQKEFALEKKPIYGEIVHPNEGELIILELSDLEDAERAYTSIVNSISADPYYISERDIFGDKSVSGSPPDSDNYWALFINGKFVVIMAGFDDPDLFTALAEITDEKLDLITAPATTPTPTPASTVPPTATPTPTPMSSLFASIPPLYLIGAAALIVIIMIVGIGISRKRKKGKSAKPQPPAEPPKPDTEPIKEKPSIKKETPPPISESITIERAIYDPCKRDFIEGQLPRMKEWVNRYDPGAYWFAVSIQNNTDKAIDEWGVELETSSALKIKEARVEGIDYKIELRETYPEPYKNKYAIGIPKEYGIVIPKGGAQRIYFKLRADKPKTTYEISGVFKSEITGDVPIKAKEFKYLCDTGVSPEAVKAELKKTFSEKDAARLALSFKTVQELDRMCDQEAKTEEYLDKLSVLKNYTEGFSAEFTRHVEDFSRFMKEEQLEYLDDAYKGKIRRFCTNLIDVWISEFLKG